MKRYLLDTHVLIWVLREPKKLSTTARRILENPASDLFVSSITAWEINMKFRIGKMPEAMYLLPNFAENLEKLQAQSLAFTLEHALETSSIDLPHGDLFDRAIFAQAKVENLILISADSAFEDVKSVKVLW